jgi:ubiquinone/menaquinone biosynthesis C-methylase UbiE
MLNVEKSIFFGFGYIMSYNSVNDNELNAYELNKINSKLLLNQHLTKITKARYNRITPIYDLMEFFIERILFYKWRKLLWQTINSKSDILEIGVGTGKNIPYYPNDSEITAIDLSERMLGKAKKRRDLLKIKKVKLILMDGQDLKFPNDSFDIIVATFVFCSVPDPVIGFKEIKRILRPNGKAIFLEHMVPENPFLKLIFDLMNPLVVRILGANINRYTLNNIKKAGLRIQKVTDLSSFGIFRIIISRP